MGRADHPWVFGKLRLSADLLRQIDDEAVAAYLRDEESCGLLFGPAEDPLAVDEIRPFENRANKLHALDPETYPRTGRMYFDIDPLKVERTIREQAERARPVKVLYHSHLDCGAYFSPTDAEAATVAMADGAKRVPAYELAYLVTSVCDGRFADRKLFVWDEASQGFVESEIIVV